VRKGDSVIVVGRLIYRTYDDRDGNRRSIHEIDAASIGPDLVRCAADLRRPVRPSQDFGPDSRQELVESQPAAAIGGQPPPPDPQTVAA
jgi:single-strand DNA-binding protein